MNKGADAAPGVAAELERFGWLISVVAVLGLLVLSVLTLVPFGWPVILGLSAVMTYGGAIYGVIAMPVIGYRWAVIPKKSCASAVDQATVTQAARFGLLSQRMTLVLNAVLLLNLAGYLSLSASERVGFSFGMVFFGSIAAGLGFTLVIVNAFWAYPRAVILGEHRALTERTGARLLVLGNRVLSYAVWVSYTVGAFWIVIAWTIANAEINSGS